VPDPVVSVVIPYYKGERFVGDAIRSVLSQTRGTVEVVVVDDGSPDQRVDPFAAFAVDDRVRVFRHDVNRGIPAARNTGVANARGRYIGFLDQDDYWMDDKLEVQLERFERDASGEIGLVFSAVELLDEETGVRTRGTQTAFPDIDRLEAEELLDRLLSRQVVTIGSTLIRADKAKEAGPFDEALRGGADDFEFVVRLAERCRFAYVPQRLLVRRLHGHNYTQAQRMMPESLRIIEELVSRRPALAAAGARARARFLYQLGRELHAGRQRSRAISAYWDAWRAHPSNPKPLAALMLCGMGRAGDAVLERINRRTDQRRRV
jgi:glycosyltransferase involved in cell wall biosynthesis